MNYFKFLQQAQSNIDSMDLKTLLDFQFALLHLKEERTNLFYNQFEKQILTIFQNKNQEIYPSLITGTPINVQKSLEEIDDLLKNASKKLEKCNL